MLYKITLKQQALVMFHRYIYKFIVCSSPGFFIPSHKLDTQCQYTRCEWGKSLTRSSFKTQIQDDGRRELGEFLPEVERVREQHEHGLQRAEGGQRLV